MATKKIVGIGLVGLAAWGIPTARAQRFEAGPPALIQGSPSLRWGAGLVGGWDRREVNTAGVPVRLDLQRLRVRIGVNALPGTHLWMEGGGAQIGIDDQETDLGTEWAAGADLHVFEHVLRESPVAGRKEWIGLNLAGSFRRTRADTDDASLSWREWRSAIVARYGIRHNTEESFHPSATVGYTIRAGLVQPRLRGHAGSPDRMKNSDDLGLLLGADLLWGSAWVTRIETLSFGAKNRELALSVSRYF